MKIDLKDKSVSDLCNLIRIYSTIYYEGLQSFEGYKPISDQEFDNIIDLLREKDPENPILTLTGWGYKPSSDKEAINHELYPISGISSKIKSHELIPYEFDSDTLYCTPKLDGCSVILYYKEGILRKVLSRGDGKQGSNIKDIIIQIPTVPKKISYKSDLIVRGELIFKTSLGEEVGNIRNQANGLIMRKSYTLNSYERSHFTLVPYQILNVPLLKSKELKLLKDLGFLEIPYKTFSVKEIHENFRGKNLEELKTYLSYENCFPIDGIIIEPETLSSQETSRSPFIRDLLAFKFNSISSETVVKDIEWNLTSFGKYFPTVIVDIVDLEGAQVSRVSGGSYEDLVSSGLGIGSRVRLIRSGGVIPFIEEVLTYSDDLNVPDDSYVNGAQLYQKGFETSDEILIWNIFYDFLGKGYKDSVVNKMCEYLDSINHSDYYKDIKKFRWMVEHYEKVFRRFHCTDHEWNGLSEAFDWILSWDEVDTRYLLQYSNLEGCGEVYRLQLQRQFPDPDELIKWIQFNKSIAEWSNIKVDDSARTNISCIIKVREFFRNNKWYLKPLKDTSNSEESNSIGRLRVLLTNFTGAPMKKAEFFEIYKDKIVETSSLSDADLVIYHKEGSSKYNKALELGIPVKSALEFIEESKS